MLQKLDPQLWVKKQAQKYYGLEVGTRMTMIRLEQGDLVIISPVELDQQEIAEINALGKVAYIIAPNSFHYLYLQACQNVYPQAQVFLALGLENKVPEMEGAKVIPQDMPDFNGELLWMQFVGFEVPAPTKISQLNEVVFLHPASKSLIITDIAFNFDSNFSLVTQLASRLLGCYQKLRPSILEKLVIRNREAIKDSILRVLEWDFERVIMAHGTIIENNGKQKLREGYEWFLDCSL